MRAWGSWGYCAIVVGGAAAALLTMLEPALAMALPPPRGGPAPLIGAGASVVAVAAALWLARKYRRNE